jgi:hypothetical protein
MTLEKAMRQVICEMTLIQYGSTQSWGRSTGDSESPGRPSGESVPMAVEWAAAWEREPTEDTLVMARAELDAWKRSTSVETDDSTLEDWVVEDGEGFAVAQVAGKFGIAEARVRRIRLKAGRESEFGMPTQFAPTALRKDQSRVRVVNLATQGCTLRQIELQTGVPRETVRRWMKAA